MIISYYNKYYENAVISVFPSYYLIVNENKFRNTLKEAEEFIEDKEECIVTLRIKPDRPETGYGYI